VLDEPTASLDPDIALKVRQGLLKFCATTGASLLVTSHDMREIEILTERVVFLARGDVVANDTPAAIASTYGYADLEQVFLSLAAEHGR
jgi:ABC-2 type transport system ATP-binding protein